MTFKGDAVTQRLSNEIVKGQRENRGEASEVLTGKKLGRVDRLGDLHDFVLVRHVGQEARDLVHFDVGLAHLKPKAHTDFYTQRDPSLAFKHPRRILEERSQPCCFERAG